MKTYNILNEKEKSKTMNCEGCQCNGCYECSSANCDICCRAEFNDESQEDMYHSLSNRECDFKEA